MAKAIEFHSSRQWHTWSRVAPRRLSGSSEGLWADIGGKIDREPSTREASSKAIARVVLKSTYVTVAGESYLFEVTYDGQIVWEHFPDSNSINRSQKYGLDYLSIIGDLNNDGFINILDAVLLINLVMENDYSFNFDINNDGVLDILDVVNIINIILDN